jgi:hypothetical protein
MRHLKTLLTSGLVIGACIISALPAMAATTTGPVTPTAKPNAAAMTQIKALRQTDKGLADQLIVLRKSNQAQRKADRTKKDLAPLLAATNDQISFETTYTTARADRLNLQKDELQLQIDRQSKNATNIAEDINKVITDLNSQISVRTTLITDAQKISKDLVGSVTTPIIPVPTTSAANAQ